MRLRPIVSLLTSLLALNLSVKAVDLTCAKHGRHGGEPAAAASQLASHADGHGAHSSDEAPVSDEAPCDTPILPECCAAATSCSQSQMAATSTQQSQSRFAEPRYRAGLEALRSIKAAPEPPPPRA